MLILVSLAQAVNTHKSFSDFNASRLNLDLTETSRNLIVSNVRTFLQLNPTDLRTKILDNGVTLDVNKITVWKRSLHAQWFQSQQLLFVFH